MVEVTNVKVHDLAESIIASGYAMTTKPYDYEAEKLNFEKHLTRAKKLAKAGGGTGHSNFRTGILVSFDIKYPQYISMELQRYHWIQPVTSQSKMHMLLKMDIDNNCNKYVNEAVKCFLKPLIYHYNSLVDRSASSEELYEAFMQVVSNCPLGLELTMRVTTNYEQLATIYRQRKNHKLKEDWGAFCRFVESLPYANELIICKEK